MAPDQAQRLHVDRAFERLYRRHALDVYRYAMAVLRNQADAEDVTQTTFMNAYRALERGDTPTSPHNWLIAIAHNVCRQRFRAQSRRVHEVGIDEDIADHFVAPEDDDTPSLQDVRRALGHLAFNQRAALVMRELEGRSYAEIADLLGLSVSAVETLIFRARRALREQLDGTLTCGQAEQLLSKQLDGELAKADRAQLRAHLRQCPACRTHARSQRAQRSALRALGALPLPQSLASLLGGGAPVAAKVAAVVVTAGVAGGVGYNVHRRLVPPPAAHQSVAVLRRPAPARAQVVVKTEPKRTQPEAHHTPHVPRAHRSSRRHGFHHALGARTAPQLLRARPAHPVHPHHPAKPAHLPTPVQGGGHGRGRGPAKADHPGRGHGKRESVPVVTNALDLTQTSQTGGARKAGEGHLHQ